MAGRTTIPTGGTVTAPSRRLMTPRPGGGTPQDGDAVGRRRLSSDAGQYRFESGTAALPEHHLTLEAAVPDEYLLRLEASGEVTPAPDDEPEPETEEEQ